MTPTNILKTTYLKGKSPSGILIFKMLAPVKKNSNTLHFISSGIYTLMPPPHPPGLSETAGGEGHREAGAVCG